MKRVHVFLLAALVSLTACSKKSNEELIRRTWNAYSYQIGNEELMNYYSQFTLIFNENERGRMIMNAPGEPMMFDYTYHLHDNELHIVSDTINGESVTFDYTIARLDDEEMHLTHDAYDMNDQPTQAIIKFRPE